MTKISNPVPEMARLFGMTEQDAWCLCCLVRPKDEDWTMDHVFTDLMDWFDKDQKFDEEVRDFVHRLSTDRDMYQRVEAMIARIGWFVQGIACVVRADLDNLGRFASSMH